MSTPVFSIEQEADFLVIKIKAPYSEVGETEITFDGHDFLFFSKPYFLRLYLPKRVAENGNESAKHNDDRTFEIRVPKETPGEDFPDLDMITELLNPKGGRSAKLLIENCEKNEVLDNQEESQADEECCYNWFLEQKLPVTDESKGVEGYGFAQLRKNVFDTLQEEIPLLVEIADPDGTTNEERKELCRQFEIENFDSDYYLADLHDPEDQLHSILDLQPKYSTSSWLTDEEHDKMWNLPKRFFDSLDSNTVSSLVMSLVDIIFAYAYDKRITEEEHSIESGWTISKLSPTLSCLVVWSDLNELINHSIRRSLVFPLFRNWQLTMKVLDDVKTIFKSGKKALQKCLLDIHDVFSTSSQYRYILNDLYITDYCIWIQNCNDSAISSCSDALEKLQVNKAEVGLELEELELAAEMALLACDNKCPKIPETTSAVEVLEQVKSNVKQSTTSESDDEKS